MLKQWHNKAHKDDFNLFVSLPITPAIFGCNPARVALIAKDLRNFSSLSERAFNTILCFSIYWSVLLTELMMKICYRKESLKETFQALAPRQSELFADDSFWRRANGGNVCLWNPLQWPIYIINPLDKTDYLIIPPTHRYISYIIVRWVKAKDLSYFLVYLRYFKRKAEKESQRKKKAGESDDEISEKETNFGIVLFVYGRNFCVRVMLYSLSIYFQFICSFHRQCSRGAV